ncbi:MAG TPA: ATP-dependent protease ATPase subunit HslU [Armatimonadetes bacterium]|jgi:ATP-dependent HslUV protease ATP-binding subunit HslU|nr:ATP-dependent protease ATPase subunit HslU [Armatimonadota bacterium]
MRQLTPQQIVEELNKYIVGQNKAKRAVAIALRNRYRRRLLPEALREEVIPKNILMIGPTGVGKTEIARRLARLANAPFVKVEATKFTEVGYVGRDVDSMVRDLTQVAYRMVQQERMEEVREEAERLAIERVVDLLEPLPRSRQEGTASDFLMEAARQFMGARAGGTGRPAPAQEPTEPANLEARRAELRQRIIAGELDGDRIELEVEEAHAPFMQVFSQQGLEEMGMDLQGMLGNMMPRRTKKRNVSIAEAREILQKEEAEKLIDNDEVVRVAIERTEQDGIIFVDELDKIAGREKGAGPDVSREGVQRDILPIIEGATVVTKYGPVRTDHILFIAAGAFHMSKPSDLIPELQGRLPIRVELESLGEEEFVRILSEPENALTKQYAAMLETEGVQVEFTEEGIRSIASIAVQVNSRTENIGARRLHTVMEHLFEELSFLAPDIQPATVRITEQYVRERLEGIVKNEDLSRYIL